MAGDRDEEEVSLIRIVRTEPTLSDVLEEVALAGVLASELPGRLVIRLWIAVGVYVDLEFRFHLGEIQPKHLRRVVDIGKLLICIGRDMNGGGGGEMDGIEREVGEGKQSEDGESQ